MCVVDALATLVAAVAWGGAQPAGAAHASLDVDPGAVAARRADEDVMSMMRRHHEHFPELAAAMAQSRNSGSESGFNSPKAATTQAADTSLHIAQMRRHVGDSVVAVRFNDELVKARPKHGPSLGLDDKAITRVGPKRDEAAPGLIPSAAGAIAQSWPASQFGGVVGGAAVGASKNFTTTGDSGNSTAEAKSIKDEGSSRSLAKPSGVAVSSAGNASSAAVHASWAAAKAAAAASRAARAAHEAAAEAAKAAHPSARQPPPAASSRAASNYTSRRVINGSHHAPLNSTTSNIGGATSPLVQNGTLTRRGILVSILVGAAITAVYLAIMTTLIWLGESTKRTLDEPAEAAAPVSEQASLTPSLS